MVLLELAADALVSHAPSVSSHLISGKQVVPDRAIKSLQLRSFVKTLHIISYKFLSVMAMILCFKDLALLSCWIPDPPSCSTSKLAGTMPLGVFSGVLVAK